MGRLHFAVGPFVVFVGRETWDLGHGTWDLGRETWDMGCFRDDSQMWSDR